MEINSDFWETYMDIILAQFKGGISAKIHWLEFLAVHTKRITPRRFRHLNQGLGLHQGFQGSPINRGLHNTILHHLTIKNTIP